MAIKLIMLTILCLSGACVLAMLFKFYQEPATPPIPRAEKFKLAITGLIAFISDTLGIGSFVVLIAMAKTLGTFEDKELPAINNGVQLIPATLASIFFMKLIQVDLTTLLTLVIGACIGGVLGGYVITRLNQQHIRLSMIACFTAIIVLLTCDQLGLLPRAGDVTALHSWQLVLGFIAMVLCGSLTSIGIGMFAMVQGVLFLMNISPVVAFPIMATAGAMQQPMITYIFLKQNKIPLKKAFFISLFGCIGVLLGLPIVSHLNAKSLHLLLLSVMIYNVYSIARTYLQAKAKTKALPAY
jgi:uncharacterized membrane protein YfcA